MICEQIEKLIAYGIEKSIIEAEDVYVVRNCLMDALNVDSWEECSATYNGEEIDDILNDLVDYACENRIIDDTVNSRDLFDTKLMGILTPMPREVIREFKSRYAESPKTATEWYFKLCCDLNYVRAGRISKDLKWQYESEYGVLDITINCSKPEKDPRDIAKAGQQKAFSYPKCQLCPENAGYIGRLDHPARQNLRPIPLNVCGQEWQLQYSPYGYYNEHCIVFNEAHVPMKIDRSVFDKLFDIIDYLPHYFVGSNADLPIVGGSILSHEHFQGGNYSFAMDKAKIEKEFAIPGYPNVNAGIVKWPLSVIRLSCEDKKELGECCDHILCAWRGYSDPVVGVYSETDSAPHNTITPIARKNGDKYECDLVLRNNITTEERPLGVFHPGPTLHHIKKENIGLIEVMGLAVLPSRLAKEKKLLELAMLEGGSMDTPELKQHEAWAKEILANYLEFSKENAEGIIEHEIGKVFLEVLCDAGVFKRNEEGMAAFMRFIESL